jgi:hypothetical protein
MNIDRNLVNRALLVAGRMPFSEWEEAGSANNTMVKEFYLSTFLEALSEISWTGGRKRKFLMKTGVPHIRNAGFRFIYDLPLDCARPVELREREYFVTEDRFLYTDQEQADLLYITNGRIQPAVPLVSGGRPGDVLEGEYFSGGRPGDMADEDVTLYGGRPADIPEAAPPEAGPGEDYPEYRMPRYESKFYQYVENMLAAKFALKLSENPALHGQLLQQAYMIKQEAVNASLSVSAGPIKPAKWWAEELGIHAHY